MSLETYKAKRKVKKSLEPKGQKKLSNTKWPQFCVQRHDATRLHYDFRLEHQGVLLSWAVPKGISLDPSVKRLAVQVEDHPLDYIHFEGLIPKGNYGAGSVLLWDTGYYIVPGCENRTEVEKQISLGLKKGHLEFELIGEKLQGKFTLIKLKNDSTSWLLIKKKDEFVSKTISTVHTSDKISSSPKTKLPREIKPMLATLVDKPFDDDEWLFETKWDGFRALAYIEKTEIQLLSRNQLSFNDRFPKIVEDLRNFPNQTIFDGEIVILDKQGRSQFQLIQNYQKNKNENLFYYAFDLLFYKGHDLRKLPLIERKEILKNLLIHSTHSIRYSDHIENKGKVFFKKATEYNLEGIIGKEKMSHYVSKRSHDWVKIKTHLRQEAVIGGFTTPRGSRKKFGALLLGVYENKQLIYIGHTGTGFTSDSLLEVSEKLEPLVQQKSPFIDAPKPNNEVFWVKPLLVCEISFSEWTQEGIMRHPVYLGLRMDKPAKSVKKEIPKNSWK